MSGRGRDVNQAFSDTLPDKLCRRCDCAAMKDGAMGGWEVAL